MKPEQITAWALDEASAEERQQLEAELREDPTAQKGAEEMKTFCQFLLAELRDDSLALTDAQRERLKAGSVPPEKAASAPQGVTRAASPRPVRWRIVARLAVAACLALGGFWVWQEHGRRSSSWKSGAMAETEARYQVHPAGMASPASSAFAFSGAPASQPGLPGAPAAGLPGLPPPPESLVPGEGKNIPATLSSLTTGDVSQLQRLQDQQTYGLGNASPPPVALIVGGANQTASLGLSGAGVVSNSAAGAFKDAGSMLKGGGGALADVGSHFSGNAGSNAPITRAFPVEETATEAIYDNRFSAPKPAPVLMDPKPDNRYFGHTEGEGDSATRQKELVEKMRQPVPQRTGGESYTRIIENKLKDVAREPLSTFSIDVDTAAYANMRRFLNQNMIPPPDAVRIEELINYFPAAEEGPAPGAKEPFGVRVEMAPCPWQPEHRLARIAIKGREIGNERKASNLVFLVDVSGSMNEPSKLPLVQQSLRMLTEQLGEGDRVSMVVYAGSSGLVLPPTSGDRKGEILAAIDKLQAGGSTHGSAGIQLAYEQAVANFIKEGVNRVILCTDGDFNVGVSSPHELEKVIMQKARSGVFLSVLGFGTGNLKDRTMETLADKGNGNYAYIDGLGEARKVLVEQLSGTLVTIAKDVKIQVEFNPAMVRGYRLIGYENRLMAKEDFNDDTKDAGEIGAGHCVVALYEVVPANLPPGTEAPPLVDNLRYQQVPAAPAVQLAEAAKNGEVMTVKLRYKEPDSSLSKLIEVPVKDAGKTLTASTEEMKFSAAVAGFGLLLRNSSYKGTLGWETVRKLALDGKGSDRLGYRGEFLQLVDKARGLMETRQ